MWRKKHIVLYCLSSGIKIDVLIEKEFLLGQKFHATLDTPVGNLSHILWCVLNSGLHSASVYLGPLGYLQSQANCWKGHYSSWYFTAKFKIAVQLDLKIVGKPSCSLAQLTGCCVEATSPGDSSGWHLKCSVTLVASQMETSSFGLVCFQIAMWPMWCCRQSPALCGLCTSMVTKSTVWHPPPPGPHTHWQKALLLLTCEVKLSFGCFLLFL